MPLYYLLVDRRMESVLGSMSIGAVLTARSLNVYARALPLCYTIIIILCVLENSLDLKDPRAL